MRRLVVAALLVAVCAASRASVAAEPVRTLDLRALFGSAPADLDARRAAYDTLVAAACVQGIANRQAPSLYLFYVGSVVDGAIDTDALWLDRITKDPAVGAGLLDGRPRVALADLDAAIDAYRPQLAGLAVWDERVPATVNAAFAAAGADDLIVVRWDASPGSLYARLKAKGLPVKVALVNDDGSSRFVDKGGAANVYGTSRPTSQSAKADAYVWALETYAKAGKLSPTELGWMLDGRWVTEPHDYGGALEATSQLQLANRDFLVARRGMPFDLSPWADVAATDDPGQPLGTDPGILDEIVSGARARAGDAPITVRGFFAWQFKYTTLEGLPAGHEPVMGEWTSVKRISPFAAGLDADAPGIATMANASFYQHVPLDELPEPQRRPTAEDLVGAGLLRGLAGNGGFEDADAGWTLHTTNFAVYADDAATGPRAHGGLRWLEVNTAKVGDDAQDNVYRDGPGVAPGERVVVRAFVRAPGGPVDGVLAAWALGGVGEEASTPFTADGTWREVRAILGVKNAGHTATRGQLYLRTATSDLDVDDVAFYAGDPASAPVEPATYASWFVGDYDAAAWIYEVTPVTWDAPGRGIVPFSWDFSGHVATRFPPFFRHALSTRTARDYFVSADSGPGYGNPSQMAAPARAIWSNAGVVDARRLDTSCGWVLDPLGAFDDAHADAVTAFDGDGIFLTGGGGSVAAPSLVGRAPVVALDDLGGTDVASSTAWILGAAPATPSAPVFQAYRAVLAKSTDLVTISRNLVVDHPDRKLRFVDPFTLFYLERHQLGGDDAHRASFRSLSLPAPIVTGAPIHVSVAVRNDGWETWRAAGANPYRVGFHVADAPPRVGALPPLAGAYPTRATLSADLPPGAEATITLDLPAIAAPGRRTLQLDVVEEGVTWFETTGDVPAQVTLDVVAPAAPDAGEDADASSHPDGAPAPDATVDATAPVDADAADGSSPEAVSGATSSCGCAHAGTRPGPAAALGLMILAALARRGRSATSRAGTRR